MNDDYFYHLHYAGMEPCTMQRSAFVRAQASWLCSGCSAPTPGTATIDAYIEEDIPSKAPLTFIGGCAVPLARRDLLMSLDESIVSRDLFLGRVYGPAGNLIDEWVTFRGRRRLIVRGSKNVSHRVCSICGRHVYFAMGPRYLFPRPFADAEIHESDLFGLIISPELMERVSLNRWKNLSVEKLKVLDVPRDKLPDLIPA